MSKIEKSLIPSEKTPHFWIVTIMVRTILGCFRVCDVKVRQSRVHLLVFVSIHMLRNGAKRSSILWMWILWLYYEQAIKLRQTPFNRHSRKETKGNIKETKRSRLGIMLRNLWPPLQVSCGTLEAQQTPPFATKSTRIPVTIHDRLTSWNDGYDEPHPRTPRQ